MGRVAWGVVRVLVVVTLVAGCAAGAAPTLPSLAPSIPSATPQAPSPTASPKPSPSATPSASPASPSLAWYRVGTIPDGCATGLVAFARGYVAMTCASRRSVWFSADGGTWEAVTLPFTVTKEPYGRTLDASVSALATNGRQVLAAGGYDHTPCLPLPTEPQAGGGPECPLSPTDWISDDGRTWRTAIAGPALPDLGYNQGGQFTAAWPVATGGWDAAVCYWTGEFCGGSDVMHSPDGLSWTALARPPAPTLAVPDDRPWTSQGVVDQGGLRLVWQRWTEFDPRSGNSTTGYTASRSLTTLSTSSDGRTWQTVNAFRGANADVALGLAASGDAPWILAGSSGPPDGWTGPYLPTVWASATGESWVRTTLPTATGSIMGVQSLISAHVGYVAVAAYNHDGEATHETWLSSDGFTWTPLRRSGSPGSDYGPELVAEVSAGIVGIGAWPKVDGTYETAVWQLR